MESLTFHRNDQAFQYASKTHRKPFSVMIRLGITENDFSCQPGVERWYL